MIIKYFDNLTIYFFIEIYVLFWAIYKPLNIGDQNNSAPAFLITLNFFFYCYSFHACKNVDS